MWALASSKRPAEASAQASASCVNTSLRTRQLAFGERDRLGRRALPGGEKERQRPRIAQPAFALDLGVEPGGLVGRAGETQRVGEQPLVLGKRFDGGGAPQHRHRIGDLSVGQKDPAANEQRRRIVRPTAQDEIAGLRRFTMPTLLQLVEGQTRSAPTGRPRDRAGSRLKSPAASSARRR